MKKSRVQAVAVNSLFGIIQKVVAIVANLAIQIIFVHTLGEQYVGVSALFTSILTVLAFAELGIGVAIVYNLYRPIAENNYDKIHAYLHFFSSTYKIITGIVLGLGLCCCPLLPYLVKEVPDLSENITVIFLLFVVDTAVSYVFSYKATFLNACQETYIPAIIHSLAVIAKVILVSLFLVIWKSYYGYLISCIVVTLAQNITVSLIANRKYPFLTEKSSIRLTKEEKKNVYKNVYAMALYKVSGVVLNSADNIIISNRSNTVVVGLLSNQILIIRQVFDVTSQFFAAITTSVGNLSTENNVEYEYRVFKTIRFLSFWLYMFCSVSLFVISGPFIKLVFGEKYICSYAVLLVLVLDFYVKGMINPISSFRTSHGLFVQGKYRPLIMAILNVVLSILFMNWMGVFGVFLATIVSRVVTQAWFDPYIVFKNVFKTGLRTYFIQSITLLVFTCLTGGAVYALASLLTVSSVFLNLLIRVGLCLIVPNALVVICFHKTSEFQTAMRLGKKLLTRLGGKLARAK